MSYNFRDDNGTFGPNASIEIPGGGAYPTNVKMQLFEAIVYNSATTGTNTVVFVSPGNPSAATGLSPLGGYSLLGVGVRYATSSTSGTVMVEKTPSGTAMGSGTNLLAAAVSTSAATLNTTYYGTPLTSVAAANSLISNGDALSILFAGTQTSLTNLVVTLYITRVL